MNLIEQAIESYWGERCPDYEKGCVVCEAWRDYDNLVTDNKVANEIAQKAFTEVNKDGKFVAPISLSIVEASIRNRVGKLIEEKDICTISGKNLNAS
jgi:hypothetical protein